MEANDQDPDKNLALSVCRLFCGPQVGTLWPYPTGSVSVGNTLVRFHPSDVTFDTTPFKNPQQFSEEHANLVDRLEKKISPSARKKTNSDTSTFVGSPVRVSFDVAHVDSPFSLDLETGYQIKITKAAKDEVNVLITADNAYGVRNALVTLSQLVVYDDIRREMLVSESDDDFKC